MRIAIVGSGMVGLCSAMLLADDGHEVTVLERDPAPPTDPAVAWSEWERRGVNQFRLPHLFLSRFRAIADTELPRLSQALVAAGACRYNVVDNIPDEMKGGRRAGDDRFEMLTGRRSVVESVTARVAEDTPGLTVRRGTAVKRLATAPSVQSGTPHAIGVEAEGGGRIEADLLIDATGRRSPLPRWIADAGGPPPAEEMDDSGFVYYGRHFASPDGALPAMFAPLKQDCGSISVLTLPADNGTWSVTIVASAKDAALRKLTDPAKWQAAVQALPLAAHWIDAEPIDDGVAVMAKLEDRIRDYAPGGRPVITGILAVGDSWSCSNPSLGRGASIGLMQATLLRDTLREDPRDLGELTTAWFERTATQMEPWFRSTRSYDRLRLAEIQAIVDGTPFVPTDDVWNTNRSMELLSLAEPDLLRANLDVGMVLRRSDEAANDPELRKLVDQHAGEEAPPGPGPSRSDLLAAIA
jgi:2-polyprenyl-6-methoxyphenol hydroxylase-like FAD-dependent oxidoreductase